MMSGRAKILVEIAEWLDDVLYMAMVLCSKSSLKLSCTDQVCSICSVVVRDKSRYDRVALHPAE